MKSSITPITYPKTKYKNLPIQCPVFPLGKSNITNIKPTVGKAIKYLNITFKIVVSKNDTNIELNIDNIFLTILRIPLKPRKLLNIANEKANSIN